MTQPIPTTTKQWNVVGTNGFESLQYSQQPVSDLSDDQVLVKIQGASLNFRDLVIPQGTYPWTLKDNVVPGSDGAGTVLAVGKRVTRFKPGDKVITTLLQQHIAGPMKEEYLQSSTGAAVDGTFRTVGAFDQQGLVAMPEGLTFAEASTLSCAGVTAWNALFGHSGKPVRVGQWVLTQGTGGVSIFAIQFAKAVGARVVATTSSDERAELLRNLGADHIINYRETPDWGSVARKLTGGVGVDLVVDVAGNASLKQSVAATKLEGVISCVGMIGGESKEEVPSLLDCWLNNITARGLWVGSRLQMEEMTQAVQGNLEKLRPVVDPKVFRLEQLKEAYEYQWSGKHQGNVCIAFD